MGLLTDIDRRNQRTLEHHNEVARHGVPMPERARLLILIAATAAVVSVLVAIAGMLVESL